MTAPVSWPGSFQRAMQERFFARVDRELRPPDDQIHFPTTEAIGDYSARLEDARRRRRLLRRHRLVRAHRVLGVAPRARVRRRSRRVQAGGRAARRAAPDDDHAERAALVRRRLVVGAAEGEHDRPSRDPRRAATAASGSTETSAAASRGSASSPASSPTARCPSSSPARSCRPRGPTTRSSAPSPTTSRSTWLELGLWAAGSRPWALRLSVLWRRGRAPPVRVTTQRECASAATAAPRATRRGRAPACGGENPAGMRFCGHCGAPAPAAAAPTGTRGGGCPAEAPPADDAIAETLKSFVAGPVAARLMEAGGKLPDERRLITSLFADVSGFTSLSERLDPEQLIEVIDPLITGLSQVVGRYEGVVDKYAGDALLALFGAPVSHEDDAERALSVALEMHTRAGTAAGGAAARRGPQPAHRRQLRARDRPRPGQRGAPGLQRARATRSTSPSGSSRPRRRARPTSATRPTGSPRTASSSSTSAS